MPKLVFNTEEEWLEARKGKITSTLASAVLGLNPYMTSIEAWEILVGLKEAEDISNKSYVKKGKEAEKHIIALWQLDHPNYVVKETNENQYVLHISDEYDFLGASGDGDVSFNEEEGMLEVKTTEILSSYQKEKWVFAKEQVVIPQNYYIQTLFEMYCANKEFVVLIPELKYSDDLTQRRSVIIRRENVEKDIEYVVSKCVDFYQKYVVTKVRPPLVLNF